MLIIRDLLGELEEGLTDPAGLDRSAKALGLDHSRDGRPRPFHAQEAPQRQLVLFEYRKDGFLLEVGALLQSERGTRSAEKQPIDVLEVGEGRTGQFGSASPATGGRHHIDRHECPVRLLERPDLEAQLFDSGPGL